MAKKDVIEFEGTVVENLPNDKKSRFRDMANKKWNETSETKKAHKTAEAEEAEIIW